MKRQCPKCNTPFEVTGEELSFLRTVSPEAGRALFLLPPPQLCPSDRRRRRTAFINERHLFTRAFSASTLVTIFPPERQLTLLPSPAWLSDTFDARSLGKPYDTGKPFAVQYAQLINEAPLPAMPDESLMDIAIDGRTNSFCTSLYDSWGNTDCHHAGRLSRSRLCVDVYQVHNSENCYECIGCEDCLGLCCSQHCTRCRDSMFLSGCADCSNCIGCINLQHRRFCVFNEQRSEEEFKSFIAGLSSRSEFAALENRFSKELMQSIRRQNENKECDRCTGDYLKACTDCSACFECRDCENCHHCDAVRSSRDSRDLSCCEECDECYDCAGVNASSRTFFSNYCSFTQNAFYCSFCTRSSNLFGCVGLKDSSYCILNKQYTRERYEALLEQLLDDLSGSGLWGEFLDPSLSLFSYNESRAYALNPCEREAAISSGFNWTDRSTPVLAAAAGASPDGIPSSAVSGGQTFRCEASSKPFTISDAEIRLCSLLKVPLPHLHPEVRRQKRMALKNSDDLFSRRCGKCGEPMLSSLSPKRPELVLCEHCFDEGASI